MARTKSTDAPKVVKPEDRVVDVSDIPADRVPDETLAKVIASAADNLAAKKELLAKLQEARMLSTFLINAGTGDREQVEWVRKYLPRKKHKGNGEEEEGDDE